MTVVIKKFCVPLSFIFSRPLLLFLYRIHSLLILFFFLCNLSLQVTQSEVDLLFSKKICSTKEIHPEFCLFSSTPRNILQDSMIPVKTSELFRINNRLKTLWSCRQRERETAGVLSLILFALQSNWSGNQVILIRHKILDHLTLRENEKFVI